MILQRTPDSSAGALPKLCGADIELGNFIVGLEQAGSTAYLASRALLAEIRGLPRGQNGAYAYSYGYGCGYGDTRTQGSGSCSLSAIRGCG